MEIWVLKVSEIQKQKQKYPTVYVNFGMREILYKKKEEGKSWISMHQLFLYKSLDILTF